MSATPVILGNNRQLDREIKRDIVNEEAFQNALKTKSADNAVTASAGQQRATSLVAGTGANNPAPATLSRSGFRGVPGDGNATSNTATTSGSVSDRREDSGKPTTLSSNSRSDSANDGNLATMRSTSGNPMARLMNIGTIGASNGQSALFMDTDEKVSVDAIRTTLNNRFPDGNISVAQLVEQFNINEPRAQNFMRHHGTAGELSIDAFMRHVSRWQDEDGNLTRAGFESAIVNGASHLNVNRFEYEEGKGYEFRGFRELYRRAGGDLPDETLLKIFNQLKALDMKGSDEHLERSELGALGIIPDGAGDVEVGRILRAFDNAAFGKPASAPTPTPMPQPKPALPPAQQTPPAQVVQQPPATKSANTQTIQFPPGGSHNAIQQFGNIQNFFNGMGVPSWSINNNFGAPPAASTMNNVWSSGNNNFRSIW